MPIGAQASPRGGETIVVTATGDDADFGGAQQIDDLPGPDGVVTIREAIAVANNTPGPQVIAFNIPTTDPGFTGSVFQTFVGPPALTLTDDGTTIDGFTQEAFTGDTSPGGGEISYFAAIGRGGLTIPGLRIMSNGNVIRGIGGFNFCQYGIEIVGDGNLLEGIRIVQPGSAALNIFGSDNIIDGSSVGQLENRFSSSGIGIWIRSSGTGNVIVGNLIEVNNDDGVNIAGDGNILGGPDPADRNRIRKNGHLSGEQNPVGDQVSIGGDENVIQGNWIGVDDTGLADSSGTARTGISINGSGNLVGGGPGAGNVIGGHGFAAFSTRIGLEITGGSGNMVLGNFIGVGADGVTPVPNELGLSVDVKVFTDVPMDTLIADNVIAHSDEDGVRIEDLGTTSPTGITLSGNRIFDNGDLGIDLGNDGVTDNDPGDGDDGPNRLQNAPVLRGATTSCTGGSLTVSGTLDSAPSETFTIEFFADTACDPSGHGEGAFVLGAVEVATDDEGLASFSAALTPTRLEGTVVTATATRLSTGDTSEFAACAMIASGPPFACPDLNGDGRVNGADVGVILAAWGGTGADLDDDGTTDGADLGILLAAWTG